MALLGELAQAQKETERRFQETERLLKGQSQEADRLLKEQSQETEHRFQETDRLIQQVSQQIGKLGSRLDEFKRLMPRYQDVRAMGAVAGMVVPEDIARYAYRRGLFVLAQSGDSVVILNDEAFQPTAW